VAFLPDTFHEVNGVARTSRELENFAKRENIPLLSIHCGSSLKKVTDGSVTVMELKRGFGSFALDTNLEYDPFLLRYAEETLEAVHAFRAQIIHVTGPGDMGCLGLYVASKLKLPIAMSWHTSLHEYAAERICKVFAFAGGAISTSVGRTAETLSIRFLKWFYRKGRVLFAPNEEALNMLKSVTGRPCFLMSRGVDADLFSPARRNRSDRIFRLGYVGRLTPEKNVRFLAELGQALLAVGRTQFEFFIVGQGSERDWLREHVPNAVLTGVLQGNALAEIYANMDLFVFPSRTDTFGNVVLEALSSGVPAIVTADGGPKYLVQNGITGYVAASGSEFISYVNAVMANAEHLESMRIAARAYACRQSWRSVFNDVFRHYSEYVAETSNASV
jgi:glycosyltransferase involved in cell wall biosynthesis